MPRYLLFWEVDPSKAPVDAKERGAAWSMMLDMIGEDQKKGLMKDWGNFVGELKGYSVVEGTEVEIGRMVQQYIPFVAFTTHAVASMSQVKEVTSAMQQ